MFSLAMYKKLEILSAINFFIFLHYTQQQKWKPDEPVGVRYGTH